MRKSVIRFVALSIVGMMLFACGSNDKAATDNSVAGMFPVEFETAKAKRSSDVEVYVGDSLYEYINGGAELYHLYKFVDVHTAYYKQGETEVVLDIYQFDSPDNAYGLYGALRAPNGEPVTLGVEGFVTPSSLSFIKGKYLVRLTGYDESVATANLIAAIGAAMHKVVPGKVDTPETFESFPNQWLITATREIHAEGFLGLSALTSVYAQKHLVDGETVTLFLSGDSGGAKLQALKETVLPEQRSVVDISSLGFDDGSARAYGHNYYGTIVVGLKKGKLVGVISYGDHCAELVAGWLETIK